jgi:hypothetical protein
MASNAGVQTETRQQGGQHLSQRRNFGIGDEFTTLDRAMRCSLG